MSNCIHMGEYERQVGCNCPSGNVSSFECELYQVCTVLRKSSDETIQWCRTCKDRQPPK